MPYIGRELDSGNYLKLDDISSSFNGSTTTFNLTAGGKAFFPGSAFSILVSLAGVTQEPEAAYQINNATITFATAPLAGDQFFCIVLGLAHGVNTPANGTVDGAKLAKPFNYDGYFYLDDANNRVGVGTATPAKPLHVVGEGQFDSVRVLGDLTVDGTTTTLDTVVTEVDRLEVGANNSTVGVAITQSGSGDILNLYDGATEVFTVTDGGKVGIEAPNPSGNLNISYLQVGKGQVSSDHSLYNYNTSFTNNAYQNGNGTFAHITSRAVGVINIQDNVLTFSNGPGGTAGQSATLTERLRITSAGNIGINTTVSPSKVTIGAMSSPSFVRGAVAIKAVASDAGLGDSNLYLEQSGGGAGYYIAIDSDGDLNFHNSGIAAPTVTFTDTNKVGIGTNLPQSQFEVYGTSPIVRSKHSSSQKYTQINHNGTDGYLDWSSGNLILRGAGNTERFRINSSGETILRVNSASHQTFRFTTQGSNEAKLIMRDASDNEDIVLNTAGISYFNGGNFGIGTNNPAVTLHVLKSSSGGTTIKFSDGANATGRLGTPSSGVVAFGGNTDHDIAFGGWTNNDASFSSEWMRIKSNGNLGIGTVTPRAKFDVRPGGHSGDGAITFTTGLGEVGSSNNAIQSINGAGSSLQPLGYRATEHIFATQASESLRITSDGKLCVGINNAFGTENENVNIASGGGGRIALLRNDTSIGSGNELGRITWYSNDSTTTTYQQCAAIRAIAAGGFADGDKPTDLVFLNTPDNSSTPAETLRITSAGNVGIGTDNPDKKFRVEGDARITGTLTMGTSSIHINGLVEYPSIRPVLDLNFAVVKTLDSRISFTRTSIGTFTGEDGLVKYASHNTPRFDHDPTTGESLGLLIEESRTNQILYSTIHTDNWNVGYGSILSNNTTETTAPDGTNTAGKWVPANGATGWCSIYNKSVISVTSGTTYTFSVWAKATHSDYTGFVISADVRDGGGVNIFATFVLSGDGSVSGTYESASITKYPNGWYRCVATVTSDATTTEEPGFRTSANGDGTKGFYAWGYQVEAGAFATSYIPTSGSTVTRTQDTPLITGTNFTDFYDETEGTLVLSSDIGYLATANQAAVVFEDTSNPSATFIAMGYNTGGGGSGHVSAWYNSSGTTSAFKTHNIGITINTEFRQAFAYKLNDFASVVNGGTPLTDNSGALTSLIDRVRFGHYHYDGITSGHIRQFKYYNKRLSNAELQGLTQQ